MGMRVLSAEGVHQASIETLGLDPDALDLDTAEAVACCLRRVAGFLCPCSARTLVHAVIEPLQGLIDDLDAFRRIVEDTLEALVAHGDLLELSNTTHEEHRRHGTLLYRAPPAFVRRRSGAIILLGVLPDNVSLLPDDVEREIVYSNHLRILPPNIVTEFVGQLEDLGYIELSSDVWLKSPKEDTAAQYLENMGRLLDVAPRAGDVQGLLLLDPRRSVRYYRGRWVEPAGYTGRFVGRRPQAYGADLWCYVEVQNGIATKLLDFPKEGSIWRGCDEAWRLQAAIDHKQGAPQVFRVRSGPHATKVIDFFSPVPMWVRRRLEVFGEPVVPSGCLFSYRISESEFEEEVLFLKERAWLAEGS